MSFDEAMEAVAASEHRGGSLTWLATQLAADAHRAAVVQEVADDRFSQIAELKRRAEDQRHTIERLTEALRCAEVDIFRLKYRLGEVL